MANLKTKINITTEEASKLFQVANNFSDTLEDIFEFQGRYATEFIDGLKVSIKQVKNGDLEQISSLREL